MQPSPLSKLTRVSEIRIKLYPARYEAAKKFYQNFLGYPIVEEWDRGPADRGVLFDVGAAIIELMATGKSHREISGVDLSIEVADVWQLWERIGSAAEVVFGIRKNEWGDSSFCIRDPSGFELTFFTRHAKADVPENLEDLAGE